MQFQIDNLDQYVSLFGHNDCNMAALETEMNVAVLLRGSELQITGGEDDVELAGQVIPALLQMLGRGETVDPPRIRYAASLAREGKLDQLADLSADVVAVTHRGRRIKCRTLGQREYVELTKKNDLTLAVGPAGTGKTYLAMALAVVALKSREAERIVLTRPAVEAGERLGFLPGDMTQKVDPYLRPLYDALFEMMGADASQRLTERGALEIAPLAFMRGRTLSDAFIILDEAQNTTTEQMKMFLTRLGANSKCIVTGDISQIDLPRGRKSGLIEAMEVLKDVPGVGIAQLSARDVVRHELVQRIVRAYEQYEKTEEEKNEQP